MSDSLEYLQIESCGKIKEFSVLKELHNLEFLILKGSNILPDLSFLEYLPNLKYLHLTMNVADGDMSLCKNIPYVRIQNRRHYSHKDSDMSKEEIQYQEVVPEDLA